MIAKDFEPDPLAEVMYHAGDRFMGSSQDLPVRESAATALSVRASGLRLDKLPQAPMFSENAVPDLEYALPGCARPSGPGAVFCERAAQLVRARQVPKARHFQVALRAA